MWTARYAPTRCRFRSFKCHQCGRIGHIKAVCRSLSQGEKASSQSRARRDVKKLEEASEENEYVQKSEEASEENEYTLFKLYAHIDSQSPYLVTLQVDGVPLQMEIDTGSSLSLISESTFRQLWPNRTWEDSQTNLTMYSVHNFVQVCQVSARPVNLSLAVVGADGPSLLGRNWIQSLQLDWPRICRLDAKPAEPVLQRHSKVFQEELGLLKGYQASIYVDHTARPRFFRPRPVPYSMRSLIEQELE